MTWDSQDREASAPSGEGAHGVDEVEVGEVAEVRGGDVELADDVVVEELGAACAFEKWDARGVECAAGRAEDDVGECGVGNEAVFYD